MNVGGAGTRQNWWVHSVNFPREDKFIYLPFYCGEFETYTKATEPYEGHLWMTNLNNHQPIVSSAPFTPPPI